MEVQDTIQQHSIYSNFFFLVHAALLCGMNELESNPKKTKIGHSKGQIYK